MTVLTSIKEDPDQGVTGLFCRSLLGLLVSVKNIECLGTQRHVEQ